ncbi:uncharacterized protein LOC144434326 [Glandiceps talaboti]
MFTVEEAINFTQNVLKIDNPLRRFKEDKLDLLNSIIRSFHNSVPFQNITLLSKDKDKRKASSIEEVRHAAFSTIGGLCEVNNPILKFLLDALGYHILFIPGTVGTPSDHVLMICKDVVHTNDQYLVDGGFGFPTFQAIPLNFDEASPIYMDSFLQYKFVRKGDIIERQHLTQKYASESLEDVRSQTTTGTWKKSCDFKLTPVDLGHFENPVSDVYQIPGISPFLISLRLASFKDGKFIGLKDWWLLEEGQDSRLHKTKLESTDEMKKAISKVCPQIPNVQINKALKYWELEIEPNLVEK